MVKQSIIINGRTLSWYVPDKVKKKKRRQKRKEPNNFRAVIKTNFVKYLEEYHKDFTTFLEEFPFFSLDTPVLIDESEKNYFQQQYEKNLRNMIKAVGHIEI